jgi:prevent-host-death family protein
MITRTVDIHEAQAQLIDLLGVVMAGDEVIITQAEKPVMRLVPIRNGAKKRVPGLHAGKGWISDDFDEPLPDEFWIGTA